MGLQPRSPQTPPQFRTPTHKQTASVHRIAFSRPKMAHPRPVTPLDDAQSPTTARTLFGDGPALPPRRPKSAATASTANAFHMHGNQVQGGWMHGSASVDSSVVELGGLDAAPRSPFPSANGQYSHSYASHVHGNPFVGALAGDSGVAGFALPPIGSPIMHMQAPLPAPAPAAIPAAVPIPVVPQPQALVVNPLPTPAAALVAPMATSAAPQTAPPAPLPAIPPTPENLSAALSDALLKLETMNLALKDGGVLLSRMRELKDLHDRHKTPISQASEPSNSNTVPTIGSLLSQIHSKLLHLSSKLTKWSLERISFTTLSAKRRKLTVLVESLHATLASLLLELSLAQGTANTTVAQSTSQRLHALALATGHPDPPLSLTDAQILHIEGDKLLLGLPSRSYPEAYKRYAAAALPQSHLMLGLMHETGMGVPKDPQLASEHYAKALDGGNADAMVRLGLLRLRSGDQPGAEEMFRRAAEAGNGEGMYRLGRVLEERGDIGGARKCYGKAANRGDARGGNALWVEKDKRVVRLLTD